MASPAPLPLRGQATPLCWIVSDVQPSRPVDATGLLRVADREFVLSWIRREWSSDSHSYETSAWPSLRDDLAAWAASDPVVARVVDGSTWVTWVASGEDMVAWLAEHDYALLVEAVLFAGHWTPSSMFDRAFTWVEYGQRRHGMSPEECVASLLSVPPPGLLGPGSPLVAVVGRLAADVWALVEVAVGRRPTLNPDWIQAVPRYVFAGDGRSRVMSVERALAYLDAGVSVVEAAAWETGPAEDRPDVAAVAALGALRRGGRG